MAFFVNEMFGFRKNLTTNKVTQNSLTKYYWHSIRKLLSLTFNIIKHLNNDTLDQYTEENWPECCHEVETEMLSPRNYLIPAELIQNIHKFEVSVWNKKE